MNGTLIVAILSVLTIDTSESVLSVLFRPTHETCRAMQINVAHSKYYFVFTRTALKHQVVRSLLGRYTSGIAFTHHNDVISLMIERSKYSATARMSDVTPPPGVFLVRIYI